MNVLKVPASAGNAMIGVKTSEWQLKTKLYNLRSMT